MTIERACEILNQHAHRGHTDWRIVPGTDPFARPAGGPWFHDLNGFEAVAVAEKLERERLSTCCELQHVKTVPIGRRTTVSMVGGVITGITLESVKSK